jgi:hypothetical protein
MRFSFSTYHTQPVLWLYCTGSTKLGTASIVYILYATVRLTHLSGLCNQSGISSLFSFHIAILYVLYWYG